MVFLVAALVALLYAGGGDLDRNDKIASVVSMCVALLSLPVTLVALMGFRQNTRESLALPDEEGIRAATEALAVAVRGQWEAEERLRRIHDPFPLTTRWDLAPDHLMDHWQSIWGTPDRDTAIPLDGSGDQLVATFRKVPSGRLVLLGRAGAGKTIIASRFVLALLADRRPADPVPVIFSLGSWDPIETAFRDWLVDQLAITYPFLGKPDHTGATLAARLLAANRVLPVLDGFDEITAGLRGHAIRALNVGLRVGDRLLLTSRPDEYQAALAESDVLTAAAVVRVGDLTVEDVARYLPWTTRKSADGTITKWHPVLERIAEPADPAAAALAAVLTTPLMVTLARTMFSDTAADPAVLLRDQPETGRIAHLENLLLTGFLPAVYENEKPPERWLRFLARHLAAAGTYDLAWWQLVRSVPRTVIGVVAGLAVSVGVWLVVAAMVLLANWSREVLTAIAVAGLVFGLAVGLVSGIFIGMEQSRRPAPSRLRLRIRLDRFSRELRSMVPWRIYVWLSGWTTGGLVFGVAAGLVIGSTASAGIAAFAGLLIGLGLWGVGLLVLSLAAPLEPTEAVSSRQLLAVDRAAALRQAATIGAGGATVLWLVIAMFYAPVFNESFTTALGSVWPVTVPASGVVGGGMWIVVYTAWGRWLIARSWLALRGKLPWRLPTFLDDAHRRGVLRQVGGVYQFRHGRLQDHLSRP